MDYRNILKSFLTSVLEERATDIHISGDGTTGVRIDGRIRLVESSPFQAGAVDGMLRELLHPEEYRRFEGGEEIDTTLAHENGVRFRLHAYRERTGPAIALRYLPKQVASFDELGLPEVLREMISAPHGIILIAGPTGAGKTTTRSALIEWLNEHAAKHIITLEDVIEYQYENKQCLIQQRLVGPGGDAPSYPHALAAAMREDPDVISIGDLRESDAMANALAAAQSGHLVIAEIHADGAYHAIGRIVSSFSGHHQQMIREQLAQHLVGAVVQRLLPRAGGGRVLAVEVLFANSAVKAQIRDGRIEAIRDTMTLNRASGMLLMDDAIAQLVESGKVDEKEIKMMPK